MSSDNTRRLGYNSVDDERDPEQLIAAMDETANWGAIRLLRSWERAHLGRRGRERLLEVGCGAGEAALALANDLGPNGEVVGVDMSERMLRVARRNAADARCRIRFALGDARSTSPTTGTTRLGPSGRFSGSQSLRALLRS